MFDYLLSVRALFDWDERRGPAANSPVPASAFEATVLSLYMRRRRLPLARRVP